MNHESKSQDTTGVASLDVIECGITRRVFLSSMGAAAVVAGFAPHAIGQVQEGGTHQPPTPSTGGGPTCEGDCQVFPYILIQRDGNDTGGRSTNVNDYSLGPETANVWIEDPTTGQQVLTPKPGQDYLIKANVTNLGSLGSFTICVDFLVWTSSHMEGSRTVHDYTFVSTVQGNALMQGETKEFQSRPWTPSFGMGLKPGDIIVRAYDPAADHYAETGTNLFVDRDRHLAHRSYT